MFSDHPGVAKKTFCAVSHCLDEKYSSLIESIIAGEKSKKQAKFEDTAKASKR